MKKVKWSDGWLLACLALVTLHSSAQEHYSYRAHVDSPPATDFYRILLPPGLVARSNADLSDLRVWETDGQIVPYVLKTDVHDTGDAAWQSLPEPAIQRKDSSDRHSYLILRWPERFRIDLLSFSVSNPPLYKRNSRIFDEAPDGRWSFLTAISIDPHDRVFRIPATTTHSLRIDIDNADNPPLKISTVSAKQAGIYLLTYLQGSHDYALLTGNSKATTPRYDLTYFTDSLTRRPRNIGIGDVEARATVYMSHIVPNGESSDKSGDHAGYLLWSILTTVLLLLIYFSVKMVSAIGSKKNPNDRV